MIRDVDWILLERWFAGECSPDEAAAIQRWIDAKAEHARLASVMKATWHRAGTPSGERARDVAAAWGSLAPRLRAAPPQRVLELLPSQRRQRSARAIVGIAAALLLAIGGAAAWQAWGHRGVNDSAAISMQEIVTRSGQRSAVTLDDGTRVLVGVASRVRFAHRFGRTRDVYLDGEAFFEVATDTARPFVVHTARGTVRALGTKFDVHAYGDSPNMSVLVAEGSVALKSVARSSDSLVLRRADLGRLLADGHLEHTANVDMTAYLAWTHDALAFDRTPVSEVIRQLARWYGVDVRLGDSALASHAITAWIGSQPFLDAMHTIAATLGARVQQRGSSYLLWSRQ